MRKPYRVWREVIHFAASSLTCFLVDYCLYTLIVAASGGIAEVFRLTMANAIARIVSASINFVINKKYVFRGKSNVSKAVWQYALLAIVILVGNSVMLNCLVAHAHVNHYAAKLAVELLFFFVSWFMQHKVIFREKE